MTSDCGYFCSSTKILITSWKMAMQKRVQKKKTTKCTIHYTYIYIILYYICFPIYRDLVQYWYNPTSLESRTGNNSIKEELVAASHQTYPKHFTNVNHRHPQPVLREWASCCTSFSRSKLSLKCFSSSFHMSHTQEKHSSVYVSVSACALSAKKHRPYSSSS